MRPYLAIIHDSFREALASRVLWVLLILITLMLLVLAPFGYESLVTRDLVDHSIRDFPTFLETLRDVAAKEQPSPARHLMSLLDDGIATRIKEFKRPGDGDVNGAFKMIDLFGKARDAINQQLTRPDFYDREAWKKTVQSSDELRDLLKKEAEKLSADEIGRRNRLLLEAAFPDFVATSPPTSVRFRYLHFPLGEPLPLRKADFTRSLESAVEWIMNWFVGALGVFVAILVTSPIIPQTFDPGSLNLLLSKPVFRSLTFLAKFFGGCMFTLVNAVYLALGLWGILGLRFDIWNSKLLLSIPIYVFIFAIYYTVSALAGVIWRNAIVCVVVSVLFWIACFTVGSAKSGIEQLVMNKTRVVQLIEANDSLLSVNEMGFVHRWNLEKREWQEVFQSDSEEEMQRRVALAMMPNIPAELLPVGPAYDAARNQLISVSRSFRNGQMVMNVATGEKDWKAVRGSNASLGTQALLREADGRLLIVSSLGLFRLTDDPTVTGKPIKIFGFALPVPSSGPFTAVGPEPGLATTRPMDAVINQQTGELAVYSRGTLTMLKQDANGKYERRLEKKLDTENVRGVALAFGGSTLLMARDDGKIVVYEAETLESRQDFSVEGANQPRFATATPDGNHFAVVFHHGMLWTYDAEKNAMHKPTVTGQGDISSCSFPANGRALVCDRATRVTEYELPTWQQKQNFTPPLSVMEKVYHYGLAPLYWAFPKPGELDKTVQYIFTGKETDGQNRDGTDLAASQKQLHPWRPVWSSLAFMAITLLLGCIYLERQEF